jgi:epoxide hydrolase 4
MTTPAPGPTRLLRTGDGVELEVADSGQGPVVLLLHGYPDSRAMWNGVTERLVASGFRVIAYDQRGFGNSAAPPGASRYSIDRIVEDAVDVLNAVDVHGPVTVVGHDWGALVSWALCLARPDVVARHVAISAGHPSALRAIGRLEQARKAYFVPGLLLVGLAEKVVSTNDFAVFRRLCSTHPHLDVVISDMRRTGRLTAGLNWYRQNAVTIATRRWGMCRVPTLGIFSTKDAHLVEDQMVGSKRFMEAEWEYVRIDGIGHWIPFEAPDHLADLIGKWAVSGK